MPGNFLEGEKVNHDVIFPDGWDKTANPKFFIPGDGVKYTFDTETGRHTKNPDGDATFVIENVNLCHDCQQVDKQSSSPSPCRTLARQVQNPSHDN